MSFHPLHRRDDNKKAKVQVSALHPFAASTAIEWTPLMSWFCGGLEGEYSSVMNLELRPYILRHGGFEAAMIGDAMRPLCLRLYRQLRPGVAAD
jgi:hypothetical protein